MQHGSELPNTSRRTQSKYATCEILAQCLKDYMRNCFYLTILPGVQATIITTIATTAISKMKILRQALSFPWDWKNQVKTENPLPTEVTMNDTIMVRHIMSLFVIYPSLPFRKLY